MANRIPWPRVLAEGVVIVVSILLAFAIDAWWDGVQERREEREILSGLREDFRGNRERLAAVVGTHAASLRLFPRLQNLPAGELAAHPQEAVDSLLVALYGARTFDPFQGTLEAILGAGKLEVIQDQDLRRALGHWVRSSDDLEENAEEMRREAQRVREALEPHGGPFLGPGPPRTSVLPRMSGARLSQIREDPAVMGAARTKQFSLEVYLVELEQLQTLADSIMVLIEAGLE